MTIETTVTSGPFDAEEPCTLVIAVQGDRTLVSGDTVEWPAMAWSSPIWIDASE